LAGDDTRLFFDQRMERAELCPIAGGQAAVYSMRGPAKLTANEDAAAVISYGEQAGVLLVADGVGGAAAGETAAALAVRAMQECLLRAQESGGALRAAILDGFELANKRVLALGSGAATTLSAVQIEISPETFRARVRPYHAGDSLILVAGQRRKVKLQTAAHSPVGFAIAAGLLEEADAMHHDERHVVSNVIGATDMRIELGPIVPLAARDTVLVASDGLSDNLHTEEIVELMRRGPLDAAAQRLAELTQTRMRESQTGRPSKPDDVSFVLFRIGARKR
jgi:serine/threonine protein phosphatase PrpC